MRRYRGRQRPPRPEHLGRIESPPNPGCSSALHGARPAVAGLAGAGDVLGVADRDLDEIGTDDFRSHFRLARLEQGRGGGLVDYLGPSQLLDPAPVGGAEDDARHVDERLAPDLAHRDLKIASGRDTALNMSVILSRVLSILHGVA